MNNLFLIGFRGTGKSSLAGPLAKRLGWMAVDTDSLIVQRHRMLIRDILHEKGEEAFRALEAEALRDVASGRQQVVATGGGIILREENRRLLRQQGLVVWLCLGAEEIARRLGADPLTGELRPALTQLPAREEIDHLLRVREPLYHATAHFALDIDGLTLEDSVETILQQIAKRPPHGLD
jgi:shikimate kinase